MSESDNQGAAEDQAPEVPEGFGEACASLTIMLIADKDGKLVAQAECRCMPEHLDAAVLVFAEANLRLGALLANHCHHHELPLAGTKKAVDLKAHDLLDQEQAARARRREGALESEQAVLRQLSPEEIKEAYKKATGQ